eukprot:1097702-Pleurochrysis_carterae.AAC.10
MHPTRLSCRKPLDKQHVLVCRLHWTLAYTSSSTLISQATCSTAVVRFPVLQTSQTLPPQNVTAPIALRFSHPS